MTNSEKAKRYDDCLRENDKLERVNSKIKSEYIGNIPKHKQEEIDMNNAKIAVLIREVDSLFNQ